MKRLFITLALLAVASLAPSQTPTPPPSPSTNSDVDMALRIYKERVSEGAAPTLILKDGQARITEYQLPAGQFSAPAVTAFGGGEFSPKTPSVVALEIEALKAEVEALKTLNAALEKELANCKPNP